MMDRITKENLDFKEFVNLITEFYQTGKIKERDWIFLKKDNFFLYLIYNIKFPNSLKVLDSCQN